MIERYLPLALALSLVACPEAFAGGYADSPQDVLIGADQVAASANYGAGVKFRDLGTGIVPWVGFTPSYNGYGVSNVHAANVEECLHGSCWSHYPLDGNGHGTFTASEIVGAAQGVGLQGVAPAGTVLPVQVLSIDGTGNSTDVAHGMYYAWTKGASVLNLSLGTAEPAGTSDERSPSRWGQGLRPTACRDRGLPHRGAVSSCAEHVRQLGGAGPLHNPMEVKC